MKTCLLISIINFTNVWNKIDQQNLDQAKKRCKVLYKNSPCLKEFIKVRKQVYRATCSAYKQNSAK